MRNDKVIYKCPRCGEEFDDELSWICHRDVCGLPAYWHIGLSRNTSGWSFKQERKILYDYESCVRDGMGKPKVICPSLLTVDVWKKEDIPSGRSTLADAAIGMLRGDISALEELKKGG